MVESKKKLLFIIGDKFKDEELFKTRDQCKAFECILAGPSKTEYKGVGGGKAKTTLALSEVKIEDYAAIIFVGGPGTPGVRKCPESTKIAKDAFDKGKIVCAICWAPTILAKAGILAGKKATCWVGDDSEMKCNTDAYLTKMGAIFVKDDVVVDGKIITANGPAAAEKFGKAIADLVSKA